jgi:hypothetical protein
MTIKKIIDKLLPQLSVLVAIGIGVFLLFFVITCTWIGFEVKSECKHAQDKYDGDCVGALIELLDNENEGFKDRNTAIWALGEMGDARALPVLEKYYTGDIPEREPLNKVISQYELKKALNLARGGTNLTAIFWRY